MQRETRYFDGVPQADVTDVGGSVAGIQVTVSEGHLWPPPPRKGKKSGDIPDLGGPFYTRMSECLSSGVNHFHGGWTSGRTSYVYDGPLMCVPVAFGNGVDPLLYMPPDLSSSDDDLDELGATAIARCEPTKSVANLSTALGELLKDGLPHLPGIASFQRDNPQLHRANLQGGFKKGSSEYLNYQFGIAPLLNDLKQLSKAVKGASDIVAQYERDAGRVVRRSYYFPLSTKTEHVDDINLEAFGSPGSFPGPNSNLFITTRNLGSGKISRSRKIDRHRWFKGAFTYYLPTGDDSLAQIHRHAAFADKLLGTNLGPETIWNLTPWSWAVDWFANVGDVLHNFNAFNLHGLVMRYGYMMETTTITDAYGWSYDSPKANSPTVAPLILRTTVKKRRPANPFGFGVRWEDLSSFQLSIAAALGLNRGRG